MKARRLVVALAATIAVALLISSGSFSSVDAERGVSIAVADDQSAFVGVETHPQTLTTRETPKRIALLTVTNNFDVRAELEDVALVGGGPPAPKIENTSVKDGPLNYGESANVTAEVTCGMDLEMVTVDITVETVTGTYVSLSRQVEITCTTPADRGSSGGQGNREAKENGGTKSDQKGGPGAKNEKTKTGEETH